MRYQQTIEIHQRLETVLRLITTGNYSTPALAATVGVSIPTISRMVASLREQGHDIRAERQKDGWRFSLSPSETRIKPSDSEGRRILARRRKN
jgi:transposase